MQNRKAQRAGRGIHSRRTAIQAGLLGLAGLSLPDLLRLKAQAAAQSGRQRDTAVIYVLQEGGPTQFETYDPKPLAPREIRGDFEAIDTCVPGVQFSELMPRQAAAMDKLVILRSIHHPSTQHSSSVHLMKTGYYCRPEANENEMPSVGSYAARVRGASAAGMPPYVALNGGARYGMGHFLGSSYNPFDVTADPSQPGFSIPNLTLVEGLTADRLADRRGLLADFERTRRLLDTRGVADAVDGFSRRAFEMVLGSAAREAFDLEAEPPATRDAYGRGQLGQNFLLARRLVEHGVTFVTVGTFNWDHHGDLVRDLKQRAPEFDRAMAALVTDIFDRGLAERVLVVAMGEFGRAPRISEINGLTPGRDHWGDVSSVLMAGGGFAGGQVIGASDAQGATPVASPYRLESVLATMYRHLGIDPELTFVDRSGRPRNLLDIRDPIQELVARGA